MERVVTINLNGNPYQLDESAYDALRAYLDAAAKTLGDNPDKAEIIRDLEQAVADKCGGYLSAAKTVVSAEEMTKILKEMGPVEGEAQAAAGGASASSESSSSDRTGAPKKRLYRLAEDAKIAGVCSGLGAYLNIDPNGVRLIFIILALVTHGFFVLVYVALMFIIPSAQTSEEWAAAHGIPFNAQEVIDEAKRQYADFAASGPPWKWRWREQRRAWRRSMRDRARAARAPWGYGPPPGPAPGPVSAFGRLIAGLFAAIFAIVSVALIVAFIASIVSLVTTGAVLAWAPPIGMPLWIAIVVLCVAFALVNGIVHTLHNVSMSAMTGYPYWRGHDGGVAGLVAIAIIGWVFYTYVPEAHVWMDHAWFTLRSWFEQTFNLHPAAD